MSGELSMFVTSVTSSGAHIKFYSQLNTEKYAALDALISSNHSQFDMDTLNSPYELKPGETVLVKSMSGAAAKWHRVRVNNIQSIEYGTVDVQFIDYGTNEVVHCSQICAGRSPAAAAVLSQPPLAVECVLAEVVPAAGVWTEAAISYVESKLLFQVVLGRLVRQDPDGPLHVRVVTADGSNLASQLVAHGLGRPAQTGSLPPGYQESAGYGPPPPAAVPAVAEFALRVKEMTTAPAQPGSEGLVTICHYSNGAAKFAIQNHHQRAVLAQLMADIQVYCRSSPPAPLPVLELGAVCLGSSASQDDQFLRGVVTQVDGGLVKVYWVDYGNDETKLSSELRAMPRQFAGPWIQASRVSLAGLDGCAPAPGGQHVFQEITQGRLLTCKFRGKEQPNQVDLYDMGASVLERLLQRGAYTTNRPPPPPAASPGSAAAAPAPVPAAPAPVPVPVSSGGRPLSPGRQTPVLVLAVNAVDNLYVQPAEAAPQLQQMVTAMTEALSAGGRPLPADQLRVGTVCAVFKDSCYHRARVVSIGRRDVKVQFVDIGTSELVPTRSLLVLEPMFTSLPPQAVHCCLAGLEATHGTAEHVGYLQSLAAGGPLVCEVVGQQGDRRVVRLVDPGRRPPLDINAALRDQMGGGQPAAAGAGPPARPPASSVSRPQVELGRVEQIVVMYAESAGYFFGQLARLDADAMYAMEEAMQRLYGSGQVGPLASVPIGTFCAAKSTINDVFYRGKVISRQGGQVTVQFIDYGDKEVKSAADVYPLAAEFTALPQLGIYCSLLGGGAIPSERFQTLVQDQTLDVMPCSSRADLFEVTLVPSQVNGPLLDQLKQVGLVEPPAGGPPAAQSPVSQANLPQQQLPVGVYKEVEVVHVVSPAEFYVQLREQFGALDALQEALSEYGGAPPPAAAAAGQLVAALYPDDASWYRGRVLAEKAGRVTVFFVDYGDTRTLPVSEVRPLQPRHTQLAGQAVRCCTAEACRSGRTAWAEDETALFRSAVLEQPYLARVEELRGPAAVVTLAKAELLAPVVGAPPAASPPQTARQDSAGPSRATPPTPPRADLDMNWRERPAGAQPTSPPAPSAGPRPGGDRFSGKMRMDRPEEYSRPAREPGRPDDWGRSAGDWPGAGAGGGRPHGRPDGGDRGGDRAGDRPADRSGNRPGDWTANRAGDRAGGRAGDRAGDRGGDRTAERGGNRPGDWTGNRAGDRAGGRAGDRAGDRAGSRPSDRTGGRAGDWSGDRAGRAPPAARAQPPPPRPAVAVPEHAARLEPAALPVGAQLRATPTWVCGLHEFFVQPLDGGAEFDRMMTEMQAFYGPLRSQDVPETAARVGKPVAARFTDGAWYRAVVRAAAPPAITVHFVDYGNTAAVERQLVKRLKQEYCRLPCHAFRCRFGGVEPAGGQWKVLPEKQLAKYFDEEMQVTSLVADGTLSLVEVTLAPSGLRVTDQLVADGLAVRPAAGRPVQQANIGPFPALERPFAAGQRLEVFVACALSPGRFFVQLSDNTAEIEEVAAEIEKSTAACKIPCPDVAADEICLAPFEDVYYRGVILSVDGDQASIYFVDYGNTEQVPVSELLECPLPLVDYPAQALLCSLTGVAADCGERLAARVDQMELTALVDRVLPSSLSVTLLDGNVNINLELGGGEARPAAAPQTAAAAAPSPPPEVDTVAPPPAAAAEPRLTAAAEPPPADASFQSVTVSYAVSPHDFYVQDAADEASLQLDTVMEQLEAEYSQLAPGERTLDQVQPGDLVAAPFSEDGAFYRARLLSVDAAGDCCRLQFIDYGNCETASRGVCRRLTPALLAPARLAQPCRLPERPAAAAWTADDTAEFERLAGTLEKRLTLRRLDADADAERWAVRLLDGGTDVGAALVSAGRALPPAAADPPPPPLAELPAPSEPAGLQRLQPGRLLDAAVVRAAGPTEFWAVLGADRASWHAVTARLEAERLAPAAAPAAGDLVVTRPAGGGAPRRARVLAAAPAGLMLLLIDHGGVETVPAGEALACPAPLAAVPPLALRCALPLEPEPWSAAAVGEFSRLVGVAGEKTVKLELVHAGDPAVVNLYDNELDVAFAMVGAGFGTVHVEERAVLRAPAAAEPEKPPPPADAAAAPPKPEPADEPADPGPAGPEEEQEVFVSHVVSPLEFYVQSADTAQLDGLMERLAAEFPAAAPLESPEPGQLAAAVFSEDGVPYRVRLRAVRDGQADVLFVDYGNCETQPAAELRQLSAPLAAVPAQAHACQLAVEACSEAADARLQELADQQQPAARLRLLAAGALSRVELQLAEGDAAALLAEEGLCRPRREPTLPDPSPPLDARLQLLISHIDTPGSFYAQPLSELSALDELNDLLSELYDGQPVVRLPAPCVGDLCVACSAEEDGWHRAAVEAVTADGAVRVRLVDYGGAVAAAEVREPAAAVCALPAVALHCRLPARPPPDGWDQESAAALAELSSRADHRFEARLAAAGAGPLVARLTLDGRPVTELLRERGVQLEPEQEEQEQESEQRTPDSSTEQSQGQDRADEEPRELETSSRGLNDREEQDGDREESQGTAEDDDQEQEFESASEQEQQEPESASDRTKPEPEGRSDRGSGSPVDEDPRESEESGNQDLQDSAELTGDESPLGAASCRVQEPGEGSSQEGQKSVDSFDVGGSRAESTNASDDGEQNDVQSASDASPRGTPETKQNGQNGVSPLAQTSAEPRSKGELTAGADPSPPAELGQEGL